MPCLIRSYFSFQTDMEAETILPVIISLLHKKASHSMINMLYHRLTKIITQTYMHYIHIMALTTKPETKM